ncbi:MAG: hypothetical protein C4560_07125 [Nitrospiraceae bacterium]|nr:MAG: hypothetical protein C4560_07125 [Nitrospiraceae bacterium]
MQYTTPNKAASPLTDEDKFPSIDVGLCSSCFKYTEGAISKDFIYRDVKLHVSPTQKCTTWLFWIIPISNTACEFSLYGGKEYRIYLDIKNISSKPIIFYADKLLLMDEEGGIDYKLENANHMVLENEIKQVHLEKDEKQVALMPDDNIEIVLIVEDWNKIGSRLQMDLTQALSLNEEIKIVMSRLTAIKYGLIVWE